MADHALEQTVIDASPARCYAVAVDFETYPEWAGDLKAATVVERDDERPTTVVAFRAAAMGRSTTYRSAYDYRARPVAWPGSCSSGDLERELDGYYLTSPRSRATRRHRRASTSCSST